MQYTLKAVEDFLTNDKGYDSAHVYVHIRSFKTTVTFNIGDTFQVAGQPGAHHVGWLEYPLDLNADPEGEIWRLARAFDSKELRQLAVTLGAMGEMISQSSTFQNAQVLDFVEQLRGLRNTYAGLLAHKPESTDLPF